MAAGFMCANGVGVGRALNTKMVAPRARFLPTFIIWYEMGAGWVVAASAAEAFDASQTSIGIAAVLGAVVAVHF